MSWHSERSTVELAHAVAAFDYARAGELVQAFVEHLHHRREPYPEAAARLVLTPLRRSRQFRLLSIAADALIQSDNATFRVRQDYAQALLDLGMSTAAGAVLDALLRDTEHALPGVSNAQVFAVHVQARGLLGRLSKQRYVDAAAPDVEANAAALRRAVTAYYEVYREQPGAPERRWHGVNALALALRAKADGVVLSLALDPVQLASELIDAVKVAAEDGVASLWDYAIAMEASLATAEPGQAVLWAERYVANRNLDAFEVASTLRQLIEVWRLPANASPGAELIALLEAKKLTLQGGSIGFDASEAGIEKRRHASLQRSRFVDGEAYRIGLERAQSVARIAKPKTDGGGDDEAVGTGVLVRGGDLDPKLGDELLLLTCAHVVAQEPVAWRYAARASEARISFLFGRADGEEPFRTMVKEVIWQSGAFDACLLRMEKPPMHLRPCPIHSLKFLSTSESERVFIAGYPRGGSLQFSLYDNLVVDRNERHLQYRAATEIGSSGSPVFNTRWEMLALHRAGSDTLPRLSAPGFHTANEGVLISAIVAALQRDLGAQIKAS